eukprot:gene1766-2105_t
MAAGTVIDMSSPAASYYCLAVSTAAVAAAGRYTMSALVVDPERVYQVAMRKLTQHAGLQEVMGTPLAGSPLRIQLVTKGSFFITDNLMLQRRAPRIHMLFPLAGPVKSGVVSLQAKKAKAGKYAFKTLVVELPDKELQNVVVYETEDGLESELGYENLLDQEQLTVLDRAKQGAVVVVQWSKTASCLAVQQLSKASKAVLRATRRALSTSRKPLTAAPGTQKEAAASASKVDNSKTSAPGAASAPGATGVNDNSLAASYPDDEAATYEKLEFRIQEAPDLFLVAVQSDASTCGDQIVGYACGTCSSGASLTHETMTSHEPQSDLCCVHSVVVDPRHRRKGIASRLLKAYLNYVVGTNSRLKEVRLICKNDLIPLYGKAGFTLIGPSAVEHGKDMWYEMLAAKKHK